MSDHLHKRLSLNAGDVVEVASDTQCNVMLMSDSEYSSYKSGRGFRGVGGFYQRRNGKRFYNTQGFKFVNYGNALNCRENSSSCDSFQGIP